MVHPNTIPGKKTWQCRWVCPGSLKKEDFCNCYEAGVSLSLTSMWRMCFSALKSHHQWAQFWRWCLMSFPLSHSFCIPHWWSQYRGNPLCWVSPGCDESDTNWLPQYSADQLWKAQLKDPWLSQACFIGLRLMRKPPHQWTSTCVAQLFKKVFWLNPFPT